MKYIIGICVLFFTIGLAIIFIWFDKITLPPEKEYEMVINAYVEQEYSGLITEVYIDRDEHSFKKVVITENNQERVILLNHEIGGLFEYLENGDFIEKKHGELHLKVSRNNFDTLIYMKFTTL